ncbi:MAG: hypothetical protein HQL59_08230 [Magnetococcales bacterium]|nr:hypothetical protein [Magnetococcales bacterium]
MIDMNTNDSGDMRTLGKQGISLFADNLFNRLRNIHEKSLDPDFNLTNLDQDAIPDSLRFRYLIFMSVDVTGSTAMKQAVYDKIKSEPAEVEHAGGSPESESSSKRLPSPERKPRLAEWRAAGVWFFQYMQAQFKEEWNPNPTADRVIPVDSSENRRQTIAEIFGDLGPAPELFKALGDEAIFFKEITRSSQVLYTLHAFLKTVRSCRKLLKEHSLPERSLNLKTTAWGVQLPTINTEFVAHEIVTRLPHVMSVHGWLDLSHSIDDFDLANILSVEYAKKRFHDRIGQTTPIDIIGPAMDLGFRLSSRATPERMPISADLALMVATVLDKGWDDYRNKCPTDEQKMITKNNINSQYWHRVEINRNLSSMAPFREQLCYDARVEFKGIPAPYPVFWMRADEVDESSGEPHTAGITAGNPLIRPVVPLDKAIAFCESFLQKADYKLPRRPWIPQDPDGLFDIPATHSDRKGHLRVWKEVLGGIVDSIPAPLEGDAAALRIGTTTTTPTPEEALQTVDDYLSTALQQAQEEP